MYETFTYIYHKFELNVGKYSSPMEHLGNDLDSLCKDMIDTLAVKTLCSNQLQDVGSMNALMFLWMLLSDASKNHLVSKQIELW